MYEQLMQLDFLNTYSPCGNMKITPRILSIFLKYSLMHSFIHSYIPQIFTERPQVTKKVNLKLY